MPVVAGLATVGSLTIGAALGSAGLLVGWLGSAVACGLVLTAARDPRATRVAVAMLPLLPATTFVGGMVLLPLWAVAGPWAVGAASLAVTGLTPLAAMAVAGRLGDRGPLSAPVGGRWLSIRLGLAACTAAVIVTGHVAGQLAGMHGRLDDGFFALLLLDLLPVLVYAIGTRRPRTVVVCGCLLFAMVAAGWTMLMIEDGNQFAGVWVVTGWMLAMFVATAGALRDN